MTRTLGAIAVAALGLLGPLPGPAQESTPPLVPAPIPAHPRDLILPEISWRPPSAARHRIALDGGTTAFLIEDSTLPLVDIVVVARAGSYYDPPDTPGLSEMTATMLRRGGTVELDPVSFDQRADELGALLTSQATMLYGAASLRCTTPVLEEAVTLLLDMIEHPGFDSGRLGSIKRNLAEGMARRNFDPLRVIEREWQWLIFGEDHFSTRPLRASDLDSLTPAVLNEFHRRHWRPENLTLAVAGDIDGERLETLFGPRLRAWAATVSPAAVQPWPPPGPEEAPRPGLFHFDADILQAKVAMGHRAPGALPTVEQRVELEVLAEILGGRGAISRLSGRLRSAEGLVYRTTTRLDPGDLWPADYQIFFDTLDRNTPRAIAAVLDEIERLRTALPHPEELTSVKRELIARQQQAFDTAEEAAGYLVEDSLVGRAETYRSHYRELVNAVTPAQVLAAARRHLRPEKLTTLVVGRWPAVAGEVDSGGLTRLERLLGQRVVHLPQRDPLTLARTSPPGENR